MILTNDRTGFTSDLEDTDLTILLLLGAEDSKAGEVHAFFLSRDWETWRKCWLIVNPSSLTADEMNSWFMGTTSDRFAVIGGPLPRQVASAGVIGGLLTPSGKPSALKMGREFAKGDEL